MPTQDTDIDALTEAELLALPESVISAGSLTKFWALHAAVIEKENSDELARERNGASLSRRMIGAEPTQEDRDREQQRQHEQALRDLRVREDALLLRIGEQERQIQLRQQEIEDNAIRLNDGRLVYVDGRKYRDGQGRVLQGDDEAEARRQHQTKPNASTWPAKTETDKLWNETERIRREIEERRRAEGQGSLKQNEANRRDRENALGRYEKVLSADAQNSKVQTDTRRDESAYSLDYSSLAGTGKGTAAGKIDGGGEGIRGEFARSAAPREGTPSSSTPTGRQAKTAPAAPGRYSP
jgi:hypothetical protein